MVDHQILKTVHITCVTLSITGFVIRSLLMVSGSDLIWRRWVRTAPHFIDTLLLISGVWLAVQLHVQLLETPWLLAKLAALLAYIVFGAVALRYGKTLSQRMLALALLAFGYIVLVALNRTPIPYDPFV